MLASSASGHLGKIRCPCCSCCIRFHVCDRSCGHGLHGCSCLATSTQLGRWHIYPSVASVWQGKLSQRLHSHRIFWLSHGVPRVCRHDTGAGLPCKVDNGISRGHTLCTSRASFSTFCSCWALYSNYVAFVKCKVLQYALVYKNGVVALL